MTIKFKLYFLLLLSTTSYSQTESLINKVQYGASLRARIEFTPCSKNESAVNFRISSNVGIAGKWMADELYPSINTEFQLYNGGLGSRSLPKARYLTFDAIVALTLTAGHLHDNFADDNSVVNRNNPLRYFSNFATPALQNPYLYSISLGTNLVFTADSGRTFQRLGFLNLNHSGIQLSYYNDGMPFQFLLLGDDYDRYHTGGGILSYDGNIGDIDQIKSYHFELSYHKFSGFNKGAFELGNTLNSSNVDYKDPKQIGYNKSLWKLNVQSSDENNGFGLALSSYNSIRYDGQHLIHWLIDNSFHIVPYTNYISIESSSYFTTNNFKK